MVLATSNYQPFQASKRLVLKTGTASAYLHLLIIVQLKAQGKQKIQDKHINHFSACSFVPPDPTCCTYLLLIQLSQSFLSYARELIFFLVGMEHNLLYETVSDMRLDVGSKFEKSENPSARLEARATLFKLLQNYSGFKSQQLQQ